MNMTMTPMPSIPPSQSRPTDVVSMTATGAGPVRRIHPLAIAGAIVVSGLFAAIGILLILSIYGFLLGVPLFAGSVTELILLGRHRNPRSTHPAWPLTISAALGLMVSAMVTTIDGWLSIGLTGFIVFGLHGVVALGLWKTTMLTNQLTSVPDTIGQG